MSNQQALLQLLGLAQRAGKVISGEELVVKSIQSQKAQLVLVAKDASPNLIKKITDKTAYYQVAVGTELSTLDISIALGKPRKVLAVTDTGFAKKMRSMME